MEKLFYEDVYQREFMAEVVDVIEKDNKYHVELDKTCFYPEGGGQPCDLGVINSIPVTYVYEIDEKIYHVLETKPLKIHRVKCSIDWQRRFDHMQQHLGQHILSAAFAELFNANTAGFHMGEASSTIDIDKIIGDAEIQKAEELANKIINDRIPVEVLYPTNSEMKKLPLRKIPPKTNEKIRIVKIGDIDVNPCCGTHPSSTIEVQVIKVIKSEKYKNLLRVEFLCGSRAVKDYSVKDSLITKMSKTMSCNFNNILDEVQRIKDEYNKIVTEQRNLKAEIADFKVQNMVNACEPVNGVRVIKEIHENADLKNIDLLATKLTAHPNVIVLFAVKNQDKVQMIFMRSKEMKAISMGMLLKDAITLIDGKGGGSDYSAQGGGKNNNNLTSALEYAYKKVIDSIS